MNLYIVNLFNSTFDLIEFFYSFLHIMYVLGISPRGFLLTYRICENRLKSSEHDIIFM